MTSNSSTSRDITRALGVFNRPASCPQPMDTCYWSDSIGTCRKMVGFNRNLSELLWGLVGNQSLRTGNHHPIGVLFICKMPVISSFLTVSKYDLERTWESGHTHPGITKVACHLPSLTGQTACRSRQYEPHATTAATATETSKNKRLNERNNGSTPPQYILLHFFLVLCTTATWNGQI